MSQTVEFQNTPHVVRVNFTNPDSVLERLPAGVYKIKIDPKLGLLLPKVKPLYQLPNYIFGARTRRAADLVWQSFQRREGIMGALVTGLKGSGKSLLIETICNMGIAEGMPVFVVDNPDIELDTLELLAKHCQPCVFLFDEFAKVYRDEKQEALLTFFSATGYSKVLCLMAENNARSVNEYLINRPGRMLFHLRYKNVSAEDVKEVAEHMGLSAEISAEISKYVECAEVSMDVLRTICDAAKGCTTLDEFKELFEVLNIPKMEFFTYSLEVDGDSGTQLDLQKKYEYTAKLVTLNQIEVSRRDRATGELHVEYFYPRSDRTLTLAGWTRISATPVAASTPPDVGVPIDINWRMKYRPDLKIKGGDDIPF